MSNSKDVPNSHDTTDSVRPELVEGSLILEKTRYLKLREEFHEFMRRPNLYCNTDKVQSGVVLFGSYFLDILEGFNAITKYEMRLTQAPALLLRGMFEALVKLLYLAEVSETRNDNPSELLRRFDSLLLIEFESKKKFDAHVERVLEIDKLDESLPKAAFNYDEAVKKLVSTAKKVTLEQMLLAIQNEHLSSSYLTYRFLSQRAHPMIEGMGGIWNIKTEKISVFNRTEADMHMWFQCAAHYTEGALFAMNRLLISENPSTSSGRTGVV